MSRSAGCCAGDLRPHPAACARGWCGACVPGAGRSGHRHAVNQHSRCARRTLHMMLSAVHKCSSSVSASSFLHCCSLTDNLLSVSRSGAPDADPGLTVCKMRGPSAAQSSLFACDRSLYLPTTAACHTANVVAPSNAIVNLAPGRISFRTASLITAVIGAITMPWKLIETTQVSRRCDHE